MLDYPTTLEDAQKVRFGAWSGDPQGRKYIFAHCAYEVWGNGRGVSSSQCQHKNGYGAAGLYCKVHAQKLKMIEGPKPKPRKRSFTESLMDGIEQRNMRIAELEKELESYKKERQT